MLSKGGAISSVVQMVSHVDHTEHDVDILVTEIGLADLRTGSPYVRDRIAAYMNDLISLGVRGFRIGVLNDRTEYASIAKA